MEGSSVAGVILAGGQGTRLLPLTQHRCKPAVGFGGRYRLIDIPLSNALNSKINQLFVISQYFASNLHQHILATYHLDLFQSGGIELLCPEESPEQKHWFAGTADAVRQNLDHLLKSSADYFLILSGDQLYNFDFQEMIQFAIENQADAVIAALEVDEREAQRMGVLKIDGDNRVVDFFEKPQDRHVLDRFQKEKKYLGSMGIYIFRRDVLVSLLKHEGDDFGHHLLPLQVQKGGVFAFTYQGYWVDIGTISSFYEANMALLLQKPKLDMYDEGHPIHTRPHNLPSPIIRHSSIDTALISQGSILEDTEIVRSIIGIRVHVKKGAKIKDSIVMGNHFYRAPLYQSPPLPSEFSIGENTVIEKAIIDEHSRIGRDVRLVNTKNLLNWDGDGVFIRDGIIIVTTGSDIPDHFIL
jgi:glucose-1-phosphate adenylyltransferase